MDNSTADNVPQILSSRLRSPRPGEISHFDLSRPGIGHSHGNAAAETAAALMPAGGLARNQIPPFWVNLMAAALTWASTMAFYPPVWVGGSRYDVSVISILCDTSPPDDPTKFWDAGDPCAPGAFLPLTSFAALLRTLGRLHLLSRKHYTRYLI